MRTGLIRNSNDKNQRNRNSLGSHFRGWRKGTLTLSRPVKNASFWALSLCSCKSRPLHLAEISTRAFRREEERGGSLFLTCWPHWSKFKPIFVRFSSILDFRGGSSDAVWSMAGGAQEGGFWACIEAAQRCTSINVQEASICCFQQVGDVGDAAIRELGCPPAGGAARSAGGRFLFFLHVVFAGTNPTDFPGLTSRVRPQTIQRFITHVAVASSECAFWQGHPCSKFEASIRSVFAAFAPAQCSLDRRITPRG